MKKICYSLALASLGLVASFAPAAAQQQRAIAPVRRTCAAVEVLQAQLAADPSLAGRRAAIEAQAVAYAADASTLAHRGAAISVTIPVVVHVVYGTASENISDAQIQSQIDVLNEDYHKLNADANKVPSVFAGLTADVGIQFVLAKQTPAGTATSGIERKSQATPSGGWGTADKIKKTANGGLAAWDATKYLNLWVGTIGGGILGYAQFPGGAAATDGVVIAPIYFGRTGTVASPYNLGRTASHEVGHWLNLNHIWGDDNGACTGTDNVADTPNQASEHYGAPSFPQVSCSNGPNGDMFMNYMDYVDDNAMFMFSTGQSSRMNALFASGGTRVGLLTSQGGVAPGGGGTTCTAPSPSAGSIGTTTATLSWNAVSGAVSYNVQYKAASATAFTTVSQTGTSLALTGLTAATAYQYQVQTVCSASSSAYSATGTFTTASATISYCTSKGSSVAYEYIDYVKLGTGIVRTSAADGGYYNGTASSTSVAAGSSQTISFSAGFVSTAYSEYFKVYADWNQDGDFLDSGETIVSAAASTSAATRTGTFTVPATAKNGSTRLRVVMSDNSATTSCGSYSYGETEDYTVVVTGGTARQAAPAALAYVLYPNPASTTLNLARPSGTASDQPLTVRVYDLRGSEVKGLRFADDRLDVSGLRTGTYLLTVSDGSSVSHQRFVKE